MKPPPFRYAAPTSIAEALELLVSHADDDARVLAGGQSLVPLMNFRLASPSYLVDLRRVEELTRIRTEDGMLVVGAMVRMADAEQAPEVALAAPLLAEALGHVGHPPIRNSATVGGSIAHADPAAELPAVALALDAEMVVTGADGTRTVAAQDFFHGPFTTAVAPGEILTEVRLPRRGGGHAFVEFANKAMDRGASRRSAALQAAELRLRPILMTTAAMVLGAVPLALAHGAGAESRQQIGWVIVGGMTLGTMLTLFVVPSVYTYLRRGRTEEPAELRVPDATPAE